ncbi:type IV secretion protein Rhs, partial [Streptomyces sp. UNOB3_S3]|nr:type IV secretion protein Rhs [Streptomyces sp. UNOB3_S3]
MTERLYAAEPVVAFGSPLREEWADRLVEARVETAVGVPARATLRFRDPAHRLLASAGIAVGVAMTVSVAAARRRSRVGIFDGEVTALETEVDPDGTFTTVRAMDRGQRLARG